MSYNRLAGLEKGNCAFLGCFRVSAAGCVHIHTRARVRASGSVGLSYLLASLENKTRSARAFPFAGKFRKQNRLGYSDKFRKLNSVGYV